MDHFQRMYDQTVRTVDGLTNGFNGQDDRLRQEGTTSTLNGKEVKWNKGQWVASSDYNEPKLLEVERENISNGVQTVANGIVNGDLGNGTLNGYRDKVVDFWGGGAHWLGNGINALKNTAKDAEYGNYEPNNVTELAGVGIGNALRLAEAGNEKAGDIGENIGSALNVDPQASRFLGEEVFAAFLTAGGSVAAKQAGKIGRRLIPPSAPKLVASSGGLHLQFASDVTPDLSQQVFDITIKNPEFIAPGVREGIAKDPDVAKQIVDRSNKVEKQANRLETWRQAELKAKTPKEKTVAKKNQKKATADLKSQMSNMPQVVQDDPIAYRVAQFKDIDKIEQHHLISKAQTAGYYDQMDYLIERDLADHDDLVAMGEYAKMRGAASGDRLSNMLNMNKIPHNEYHTYLRETGQEIKPEKIREIVRKANNADELMELYKDFIDNQISVKQDAIAYQNLWDMDK